MKVTIENYRGFDIEFDTEYEKFQCICTEEDTKESKSFSAVKKFVDEYKKNNQDFKPFYIIGDPRNIFFEKKEKCKVIGVRKDGRFVAETDKGDKKQISDYDLSDYIIYKEDNERFITLLAQLESEEKAFNETHKKKVETVYNNMDLLSLKEYKKTLLA